ncbi:DoxX family membrane protein [Virgibacillus ndiopensis]|uniref:DoxX family membrane protein n=1 Tax=Virgibacillus ndiopensis TaxID=2004408 RepID=UPI000C08398B|nr:DoxX family membrane protein [Virgibacillus ndiopensis]
MSKILSYISRYLLGFIFLVAGVNGYFVLFNLDPFIETSPEAMALFEFDYLLTVEKSIEILCGVLLLINRFVPLALAILSPIVINIMLLHLFLDHSLLPLAVLLVVMHSYLLYFYRRNFIRLLEKRP